MQDFAYWSDRRLTRARCGPDPVLIPIDPGRRRSSRALCGVKACVTPGTFETQHAVGRAHRAADGVFARGCLIEPVASTTHDQSANCLLELADITGPCVSLEPGNHLRTDLNVASIPTVEPLEKE